MRKTPLTIRSVHRHRREVSLCLGVLAILFQMAMPFASAFAANLPGTQQSEVICDANGRLIRIGGTPSSVPLHSAACEFCLACPFSVFSPLNAPNALTDSVLFTDVPVVWTGLPVMTTGRNSDYAILPVRAPPSFV